MKKYFVLTSVLALCACGGGGGGGVGIGTPSTPIRAAVSDDALTSNSHVTSMASEILINTGNPSDRVARSGTVSLNGKTYKSYRLDDVNFRVATGANNAYMKFHMDTNPETFGQIDSLVMNVGTGKQYMDRRSDDTADFRGIVYEYVTVDEYGNDKDVVTRLVYAPSNDVQDFDTLSAQASCPNGETCRWDRIDQAFRVVSEGTTGNESTDFKYADFGKLLTTNFGKYKDITDDDTLAAAKTLRTVADSDGHITTDFTENWGDLTFSTDDYDTFAGGYSILRKTPSENMYFKGKAVGSVYATDSANHPDAGLALQDNNATLHFVDGTETLSMNFTNWYDVTVTKTGNNNQIVFDNYNNANDYFKFHQDTGSGVITNNFTTTVDDLDGETHTKTEGLLDMGYYGLNTPEEAAGMVRYKEIYNDVSDPDNNVQYEHEFRAGYGMKPYTPTPSTPEP